MSRNEKMRPLVHLTGIKFSAPSVEFNFNLVKDGTAQAKDELAHQLERINWELKTDTDFAEAKALVKSLEVGESKLKDFKQQLFEKTAGLNTIIENITDMQTMLAKDRLALSKLVKSREADIRKELIEDGENQLKHMLDAIYPHPLVYQEIYQVADFPSAVKSKRTIESLKAAIEKETERAGIILQTFAEKIKRNMDIFARQEEKYSFLFSDKGSLLTKDSSDLINLIKIRIDEYEAKLKEEVPCSTSPSNLSSGIGIGSGGGSGSPSLKKVKNTTLKELVAFGLSKENSKELILEIIEGKFTYLGLHYGSSNNS